MIKARPKLLFVIIFFSFNIALMTPAYAEDGQKNIRELLTKFGMTALVAAIPITIKNGLLQQEQEKGIKKKVALEKVSKIVNENYSSEIILDSILARLMKTELSTEFQSARYDSIQKLLNSESALKLVALKEKSRSAKAVEEIKKIALQHEDNPMKEARLQLLESFDNAAAETEFSIAAQALSIEAILKITNAAEAAESKKSQNESNQDVLSSTYELLLRPSKYTTMMTLRHTFEPVSDEELKQYILIYRQKQVQWLLQNVMVALSDTMQDATNKAIQKVN